MGQYRALLVANSKFYADPERLPELKAPIYDMARLQDALIHPEIGLFDRERVQLLPNARCSDVLVSMEDYFQSAEPEDTMLLYYSGHGKLDINNNFFLCAADTRMDRLIATAVRDEQVNAMMRSSPARTFVVILDCCSSGAWKSPAELLPDALKGSGRFLLTSSRAGQNSGDAGVETESSAFTKLLVEAMEEADLDTDQDGYVDIDEIYKHVERNLRVTGQQAQRDFGKSARSVALARRARSPRGSEPARVAPVGPQEPPSLTVTPERIQISGARTDELPLVERVYVFNRGGGTIAWSAESDDEWISLEPHQEFVKVSLRPPSVGAHRGSIYVREEGGAVKRVRVTVQVEDAEDARPAASVRDQETVRRTGRRRTALVGLGVSLLALSIVIALIVTTGGNGGSQDGGPTTTQEPGKEPPTKMVLTWAPASVAVSDAPSQINGITHKESEVTGTDQYVAVGSDGPNATMWRYDGEAWQDTDLEGGDEAAINGLASFGDSFVAVGWSTSEGDQDAAVWMVPVDGEVSRIGQESLTDPGDQVMNKVLPRGSSELVVAGRDGSRGAIWSSADHGDTWVSEEIDQIGAPSPAAGEVLRVRGFARTDGDDRVLVAVGYVKTGAGKDGAVWVGTGSGSWDLIQHVGGPGDQVFTDVTSRAPGELVVVGYTSTGGTDELDAAVWRSEDNGATWIESSSSTLGGSGDQVIYRVLSPPNGTGLFSYIAGGYDASNGNKEAALWYSRDGITWVKQTTAGTPLEAEGDQVIFALEYVASWGSADPPKVLAVGSDAGRAAVWEGRRPVP